MPKCHVRYCHVRYPTIFFKTSKNYQNNLFLQKGNLGSVIWIIKYKNYVNSNFFYLKAEESFLKNYTYKNATALLVTSVTLIKSIVLYHKSNLTSIFFSSYDYTSQNVSYTPKSMWKIAFIFFL